MKWYPSHLPRTWILLLLSTFNCATVTLTKIMSTQRQRSSHKYTRTRTNHYQTTHPSLQLLPPPLVVGLFVIPLIRTSGKVLSATSWAVTRRIFPVHFPLLDLAGWAKPTTAASLAPVREWNPIRLYYARKRIALAPLMHPVLREMMLLLLVRSSLVPPSSPPSRRRQSSLPKQQSLLRHGCTGFPLLLLLLHLLRPNQERQNFINRDKLIYIKFFVLLLLHLCSSSCAPPQ